MAKKTKLKIITPNGIFLEKEIDIITIKTTEGYKGFQYGIQPIVASLVPSKFNIRIDLKQEELYILSGIIYAEKEFVNIITDSISYEKTILEGNSYSKINNFKTSIENIEKEIKLKKEIEKTRNN